MPYKTFGFTSEQVMIRDSVLALMQRVLPIEKIRELEARDEYPAEAFQALARDGWLSLPFQEVYGGGGASYKDLAVLIEALGYHHAGITSAYMTTVVYGGMQVQSHADEELKRQMLPRIMKGELRMAISYTEPSSGSDAAAIRTRAVRRGDDYVITGQKVFTTNGHVADFLIVSTKTRPDAGHRGISLFVVDTRSPGVTIRPLDSIGRRTSLPNEVFLDDVRVPARNLLGKENEGWPKLMRGLNLERLLLAAAAAGQCMKIIEMAREWARTRVTFGRTITEYQAISHKFAEMAMLTESVRLHAFNTAEMLDAGEDPILETAMAKTIATEHNIRVADLGVQIMGGMGYMRGDMSRMWLDARQGTIGGGSSEIMRNVISRLVLA